LRLNGIAITTELSRDNDKELDETFATLAPYWKTLDEGCSTTLVAATDPALNGKSGYLVGLSLQAQD